jgi:hypothetical protein
MINQVIGRLTVIQFDSLKPRPGAKGKRAKYWKCLCECGNVCIKHTNALNSGRIVSCGCKKKENGFAKRKPKPIKERKIRMARNFSGHEGLSGDYVSSLRRHARDRNIAFDDAVTAEFLWLLLTKQNFICKLSGLPIEVKRCRKSPGFTASLDRIDSSKPYTIDNVQWVHKDINWLKNRFGQAKFIDLCGLVTKQNLDVSLYT